MQLYFDSFVFDLIKRCDEAAEVRWWRKANGHKIGVSVDATIVEALRIDDRAERDARLRTILQVGTQIHPPYDYRHYREIADELWRLRPAWFRHPPDRRRISAYLRKRKHEWLKLKDPSKLPDLTQQLSRIHLLIGRDMTRQKLSRQHPNMGADWVPRHTVPDVQACVDRRRKPDAFWRYVASEETRPALDHELRSSGHLEWLVDFKWPQPASEYHRFWMCDADAKRVPLSRIVGLAEFYQRRRKVTPGNPVDRLGHAPHLVGFDLFVTTDRRLSEVLADVKADMPDVPLSRVALIDSESPSALDAIKDAIGQARHGLNELRRT